MTTELQNFISEKLKEIFKLGKDEWAEVYITPLNRVDITIVSNKADSIEEDDVLNKVNKLIYEYNSSNNASVSLNYTIGFIEIYTIEDAEDFGIRQMEIKREPITWSDVVNINKQKIEREKRAGLYKVINFYSYKGGVGRTIALIQVAYLLAKQGKRVLLMDLDIEAPSLHRIFKEQVNNKTFGVTYGLVDYLFEKTMSVNESDQKIKINELFCEINLDEPISGSIYLIPATKHLNSQYIFKLSQLQTHIIYENKYLEDLLQNFENEINIDTVLIDSRTGINQWGAFSLLGFSDQIVFVTYPNEENIEGINQVIKLMDEAGLENYVVAMSKIVDNPEGQKYSDSLFKRLNVNQMIPINIPYNSAIAMTDTYPAKDITEPYKVLSDYIIENDNIDFNISYLKKADRQNLANNIFYDSNDSSVFDIVTDLEKKVLTDRNCNVFIYNKEIELNKLAKNSESLKENMIKRISLIDKLGKNVICKKSYIPIWCTLEQIESVVKYNSSWNLKWFALILYELNFYKSIEKNSKLLNGFAELQGKDFEAYCNYLEQFSENEILEIIKSASSFNKNVDSKQDYTISQDVSVFVNISLMFKQVFREEWLLSLINIIKIFKQNIPHLRIVVAVSSEMYKDRYEKFFNDLKSNIIRLEWHESDIKRLLLTNIDEETFKYYLQDYADKKHRTQFKNLESYGERKIKENNEIYNVKELELKLRQLELTLNKLNDLDVLKELKELKELESNLAKLKDLYNNNIEKLNDIKELKELYILDLIIGTRTICGKYSEKMLTWLTKKLKNELPFISSEIVINIMKSAVDIEIQSNNKDTQDRLISVKSIEKAIDRYLSGLS